MRLTGGNIVKINKFKSEIIPTYTVYLSIYEDVTLKEIFGSKAISHQDAQERLLSFMLEKKILRKDRKVKSSHHHR